MDKLLPGPVIYLLSEVVYININHVGAHIEVDIPYIFENLYPRKYFICILYKIFEQAIFRCSETYRFIVSFGGFGIKIQFKVGNMDAVSSLAWCTSPSYQRSYTGLQLSKFEWFNNVIISSAV